MPVPPSPARRPRLGDETGIALPTALFAMVMLALLAAGIWVSSDAGARSTANREEALRAMQLAEAGAAHALGVLRTELADTSFTRLLNGADGLPLTADDGLLTGYGLATGLHIPATGVTLSTGSYTVQIVNDPADTTAADVLDTNDRILLRCTGVTSRGGRAVIDAVIAEAESIDQLPTVLVDGKLLVEGNPAFLGPCGRVHSNDDLSINGNPTVEDYVSSSDDVNVSGSVKKQDGSNTPRKEDQPQATVEDIVDPLATHCDDADYLLRSDGWILRTSDNTLHDARSNEKFGWKRSGASPVMWDYGSSGIHTGTFCVYGNATMSGSPGETTASPVPMSIIASGSIEVSGKPRLTSDSETGFLFLAAGDLKVSGSPIGTKTNYTGRMYARHQCDISGTMKTKSQITCKDLTGGSGIKNLVDQNRISGNVQNTTECASSSSSSADGRAVLSWSQRFGI